MATRKRTKKHSLVEFRAWLSGVEELQPDDWAPNATQWKTIREKIDSIVDLKPTADTITLQKLLEELKTLIAGNLNFNVIPQRSNTYEMTNAHIPPPPALAGGVPVGPVTEPTAEARAVLPPQQAVDITAAARPNLDTSDGNYESGFS